MLTRLPPLSALRAFEAAARLRSFKQAANELAVTPTAVSHRIRVLEAFLACPLFVRKVRAVELTAQGQTLLAGVRAGFDAIALATEQIRQPRRASVTLSTTPAFATQWLVPKVAQLQAARPDIDLHIHASNAPADLHAGSVDLAIRYGCGAYPDMHVHLLLQDRFAPVASPALATVLDKGWPHWPLIHFDWHHRLPPDLTWNAWSHASGLPRADLQAGLRYSEESHAIQAAVAGQGVALLSLLLVERELRMGLLRVADGPMLPGMAYHLIRSRRRAMPDAVAAVQDWLIQAAHESTQAEGVDMPPPAA